MLNKVGIIIVGYNSKIFLMDCLGSLFSSDYKNFKVYFIDNASSDGSAEFVKSQYKKIDVTQLEKNLGFAKANDIGLEKAISDKCEFVFLLNPDTVTDKECLGNLMQNGNDNTILQPLILLHDGKKKTDLINTSGNILNYLGMSYVGNYKKNYKEIDLSKDLAVASGAAMLIPVKIIKEIGLFDEDFFMYHEDVDFSWRARLNGNDVKLIPEALIWHKYSFSNNKNKIFYVERNRLLFLFKNFSFKYLLLISPLFIVNEIFILLYSLLKGWFLFKIRSYVSIIGLLGKKSASRKKNLKNIYRSEKRIKRFIGSEISFLEVNNFLFGPYNVMLRLYWKMIYRLI